MTEVLFGMHLVYAAGPSVLNHNLQIMTDTMQSGMQQLLMSINTA